MKVRPRSKKAKLRDRFTRAGSRDKTVSVRSVIFFTILIGALFFVIVQRDTITLSSSSTESDSAVVFDTNKDSRDIPVPKTLSEFSYHIRSLIDEEQGTYSVRFEDFNTNEAFGINDDNSMTAASVIKLPILASLYHLADEGKINLDDEVTIKPSEVQNWGTGTIRYESQPIVHTNRELAKLMIEESDNTAAFVFTDRIIGTQTIQNLIESWGLRNTNIQENLTSNKDMSLLIHKMENNELASKALTKEMIGWMDYSSFEDRLPALLPDNVHVYHKIGNEVRVVNDVGMIVFDDNKYYIGVLTEEIPDIEHAKEVIATISKLAYNYEANKK